MLDQLRQPLRSRRFRLVWAGEGISILGDLSFEVAFIWLVLQETGSAATLAGVVLAQAIPRGVLMLIGGAMTDRLSPRTVMLATHLSRGTAVVALGLASVFDGVQTWQFYAIAVVMGTAEAFFWPASDSIVPSLVEKEDLARANALTGFNEQGARLLGPVLGGALVASAGATTAIFFNAATFFLAALSLRAVPARPADPEAASPSIAQIRSEIVSGLRYARRSREVRSILLLISAAALSYSGLFSVGLPALSKSFSESALTLGLLISSWGLGQLAGTIAAAVTGLPRRWGLLIIGMTLCEGLAFATLGFLPTPWAAATLLAVLGVGVAYSSDVALPTYIQTRTPADFLGRINSIMSLPRVVLEPVSFALMGLLVTVGVRWGFLMAALPMLLVGITMALSKDARSLSTQAVPESDDTPADDTGKVPAPAGDTDTAPTPAA
ncbi:MFS transporter [Streptomyces sp. R44]|uniref:MFS transporter n=1 Tax=Streptomyces sp. R44 TaxID=3238633 RepID=A0AB39T247_9ACTN